MPTPDASPDGTNSVSVNSVSPITQLSDAQVFDRDPEDYTTESTEDTIARLSKIIARQRKARQDDAEIAALTAKIKKANRAKKPKKGATSAELMDKPT